jgi:hypothetical protein
MKLIQALVVLTLLVIANRCHPEVEVDSHIPDHIKGGHRDQIR